MRKGSKKAVTPIVLYKEPKAKESKSITIEMDTLKVTITTSGDK